MFIYYTHGHLTYDNLVILQAYVLRRGVIFKKVKIWRRLDACTNASITS